jgi:3-dehydroquinate dehydratase-1
MRRRIQRPSIGGIALGGGPRVVLCVTDARGGRLPRATRTDFIEARIDLFSSHDTAHVEAVLQRLGAAGAPIIATIRVAAEGGRWRGTEIEREALFLRILPLVHAVDVEFACPAVARRVGAAARARGRAVIVSAHDFERTPPATTLRRRIATAHALGADMVKLAAHARTLDDVATLLRLLLDTREIPLALLALGPVGTLSRVFFPAAGSVLTYAFAAGDVATGPGQIALPELHAALARFYPGYRPGRRERRRS